MPKKAKIVVSVMVTLSSKKEWLKFFENEKDMRLNVVDLHPQWCGGVGIMIP
jgi:hypothetical protein